METKELKSPRGLVLLAVVTAVLLAIGILLIFFHAPQESKHGFVQKIFYFHVPSAWMMLLSAPLLAVSSILYLVTRQDRWDRASDATIELAILFGLMVIISGPLWGYKAWGRFWVWDVRLTSTLVLVLTLIACKVARVYAGPLAGKQIAAGLAVMAVLNATFVYFSIDIWGGHHPPKLITTLEIRMKQTFWFNVIAFHFLYALLLWLRLRLGRLRSALDHLHMKRTEVGL